MSAPRAIYRALSDVENIGSLYYAVETGDVEDFGTTLATMMKQLTAQVGAAASGFPPSESAWRSGGDDDSSLAAFQGKAARLGYALRLDYLREREAEGGAPALFNAWMVDRDPATPADRAVDVRVLLTRDQLSDLDDVLARILDRAEEGALAPQSFSPTRGAPFPAGPDPAGDPLAELPERAHAAPFGRFFINSTIVAVTVVAGNLIFCSLAGYAFARINFAGKNIVFILLLATLMVPFQVTMIPAFLIVKWLGLHVSPLIGIDSLGALIVPSLVQVFGIFMLRQFFRTLPIELEEAARIDGASRLGVLFKIILPLSLPALSTLAALMFLFSWNDFLWPLIVIQTQAHQTVQLGLAYFQGAHVTQWTLLMAGNVMSLIPMLIVFFLAQRYFVRSVATSGLKG